MSDDSTAHDTEAAASAANRIAERLQRSGQTAAAAESVTGGNVSCRLSAAPGASEWLRGGVLAYAAEVKFGVLGVTPGPVITARCATEMADGVARVLQADFAVATTGAGGPRPEEDQPVGTVFIAVATPSGGHVRRYRFDGEPAEVVFAATRQALDDLESALINAIADRPGGPE